MGAPLVRIEVRCRACQGSFIAWEEGDPPIPSAGWADYCSDECAGVETRRD